MKKLKLLALLCCVLFALTGCGTNSAETSNNNMEEEKATYKTDYPHYKSVKELLAASNVVLEGKIVDIGYQKIDMSLKRKPTGMADTGAKQEADPQPYTVYTIQVENTYYGKTSKKIMLQHIGGNPGATSDVTTEDEVELNKGKSYLFILSNIENSSNYQLVNVEQCIYPNDEKGQLNFTKNEIIDGCK